MNIVGCIQHDKPLYKIDFHEPIQRRSMLYEPITWVDCEFSGTIPAKNPLTPEEASKFSTLSAYILHCNIRLHFLANVTDWHLDTTHTHAHTHTHTTHRIIRDNQLTGTIPPWITSELQLTYLCVDSSLARTTSLLVQRVYAHCFAHFFAGH